MTAQKRILLVKLGSLGDIFLILGALRDLAEYAGAPVDVLTEPPYAKIFKRSPDVANVIVDQRRSRLNLRYLASLRGQLTAAHYDLIVDLQNSKRTLFYRRWLTPGVHWCQAGTDSPDRYRSDNTTSKVLAKFETQLNGCGLPTHNLLEGNLDWLVEETDASARVAQSERSVVLLPGASARHAHKIWPHYNELAVQLKQDGYTVFVVPGPDDMELCRSISGELLLNGEKWLDFFQLAGVLKNSQFVVGNDSGPTHLAASLGCPGVALFSERTAQYASNMQRRQMQTLIVDELKNLPVERVCKIIDAACISG